MNGEKATWPRIIDGRIGHKDRLVELVAACTEGRFLIMVALN